MPLMPTVQRAGSGATVTGIATLCGFSDLGRFAVRYRQLDGQPPSQTLRQAAQSLHRHSTGCRLSVCRRKIRRYGKSGRVDGISAHGGAVRGAPAPPAA
jgi:AraC-like DNA-binding protein